MRSTTPVGLLCLLLLAGAAAAEPVVIASGIPGGYYDGVASRLRTVLVSQHGVEAEVRPSTGSLENLAALADPGSPVSVALCQTDALQRHVEQHPEFADQVLQLADTGRECAFLVTGPETGIAKLSDLTAPGDRQIAVGRAGSGAAITWEGMARRLPGLAKTRAVDTGFVEALLQLRGVAGTTGPVVALRVQRPNLLGTPLEIVTSNPDAYRLIPIRPGDLGEPGPSYRYEKVVIGFGRDGRLELDTLCTGSVLLAAKGKLDAEARGAVIRAVTENRWYLVPGRP